MGKQIEELHCLLFHSLSSRSMCCFLVVSESKQNEGKGFLKRREGTYLRRARIVLSCLIIEGKGETRKGEIIDKEECHLLCALLCSSVSLFLVSSLLFSTLPEK